MNDWISIDTRTLRENVTDLIRQAIIEGRLAAGSELNQAQIAEKLGISRGPVREALGQLEQEGLIHNVPYKGVVITSLTPHYVRELYSLRSALETFAVTQAITKNNTKDVHKLKQVVKDMRQAAKAKDHLKLVEIDLTFHRTIVEMAQHELLKKTWVPMEMGVKRCLYARHQIYRSLDEVIGTHPALIEAIQNQEVKEATRILQQHILDAGEKICQLWEAPEAKD
jgi:DNA-binding GntR family transcriptional regulator